MSRDDLVIVRTGSANLASVRAAFQRLELSVRVTEEPSDVTRARHVVLPGVGSFGAAMTRLGARGLDEALRERIERREPTLAICLGMQLLFRESEETPGQRGLGVIDGTVGRFDEGLRVPQIGWNDVTVAPGSEVLRDGCFWFANSYRVTRVPRGWKAAVATHGGRFVAALESGPVVLCQFHPELSGAAGSALLRRWWRRSATLPEGASC